jgi:hypothetical protein
MALALTLCKRESEDSVTNPQATYGLGIYCHQECGWCRQSFDARQSWIAEEGDFGGHMAKANQLICQAAT